MKVKVTIDGKEQPFDFNLRAHKTYKELTGKAFGSDERDVPEMVYSGYVGGCKQNGIEPISFDDFIDHAVIDFTAPAEGNP